MNEYAEIQTSSPRIPSQATIHNATLSSEIQRLAKIGSWERDMATGIIYWSQEARYIVNVPDNTTIDDYINHYVHPDDRKQLQKTIHEGIERGVGYEIEYRVILDDGTQKDVLVSTIITDNKSEDGVTANNKRLQGFIQDITSLKTTQRELAEQRFLLKESQQIAQIAGWEYDILTNSLTWSDEYYTLIKRTRAEYPPTIENYYAIIHHSDRQRVYEEMQEAMRGRGDAIEYRIVLPDETVRHIRGYGNIVRDSVGDVVKLRGVIQDISETKRSERQLKRLSEVLNQAQHLTGLGSWERDLRSGELSWSDEFFRQLGYVPQQFQPEPGDFIRHVHPDDRNTVIHALQALANNTIDLLPSRFVEYRILRADGTMRYMRGTGGNVLNSQGNVSIIFGTLQDVTEIKEVQMRVETSEEKFRRLFEQSSVGQIMYDKSLVPLQVNSAFLNIIEYSEEEFLSLHFIDTVHPDDHHKFNEQMQALWLGNIPALQADMRFQSKSGNTVWCRIQATVFEDVRSNTVQQIPDRYILVAVENITQYRQVEEAIQKTLQRERETLELRHQLMAKLSQRINIPLSAIGLAAGIMHKHHARMPEEKLTSYLDNITASVEEIQSLMSNLILTDKLETGRAQLTLEPLNIVSFCKRLLSEFTAKHPHRPVDAAFHAPEGAIALADHELLRLILWHLLLFLDRGLTRGAGITCTLEVEIHSTTQAVLSMKWLLVCSDSAYTNIEELLHQNHENEEMPDVGLSAIQHAVHLHGGTLRGKNTPTQVILLLTIPIPT